METEIKVGEAMEPSVVTVGQNAPADEVARMMATKDIGSVVIVNNDRKPIGIVTERDFCFGVVAKNKMPSKVKVKDIMSAPLKTVVPDMTLKQASRLMAKHNIRRLPVIDKGVLVGIITNKDILAISPQMIEILEELSKMNAEVHSTREAPEKGTCEVCGDHMIPIYEVDGIYVCESCKEEKPGGE